MKTAKQIPADGNKPQSTPPTNPPRQVPPTTEELFADWHGEYVRADDLREWEYAKPVGAELC